MTNITKLNLNNAGEFITFCKYIFVCMLSKINTISKIINKNLLEEMKSRSTKVLCFHTCVRTMDFGLASVSAYFTRCNKDAQTYWKKLEAVLN